MFQVHFAAFGSALNRNVRLENLEIFLRFFGVQQNSVTKLHLC